MLTQTIINILSFLGPVLCVLVCSMLPLLESKVAIPLGTQQTIFQENSLSLEMSFFYSLIGSTLVGILLVLLSHYFVKKLKQKKSKLILKIENSLEKINKKFYSQKKYKQLIYLFLFVFLPIPLAGLYSGAILSAFLKLKTFESIISITLGNLFNCFLIYLLCLAFKSFISLFLSVIIILIILASCYKIISFIFNKSEKRI